MNNESGDRNKSGDLVTGGSGDRRPGTTEGKFKAVIARLALSLLVIFALSAFAAAADDDDDSARGGGQQTDVGRISLIHGDVSMQRGDSGDWSSATLNTPLVRGDQIATGERSQTEVQLDYANILRLSSQSQAKIADLTRTRIQIQLAQGYANYSVFKGSEADVEIDTPNVAIRPLKHGRYRIQVLSDSETEVVVREGEAEIDTPQGGTRVKEYHRITVRGTSETAEYKVDDAPGGDDWDRFNKDRDRQIRDAVSWRHTNGYYTGAHDLDAYGRWVYVPGYGNVWQPYQDAAWAPYHDGRWVWEPYWGWTWVSYEPWGWAPYHYGRWFFWGSSWVWWPGPVYPYYRPFWAPAFVTFIGFGHHAGFAYGVGSIGWIPVGPGDNCYPWWGRGFNRVNVVNITNVNVVNVHNDYYIRPLAVHGHQPYYSNIDMAMRNPRVRAGISGVDTDHFGRGDMRVRRLDVKDDEWRESRVMRGNLPVVPTRDSLHTGAETRPSIQPRDNDRFFTRHQPPAALPGFNDQRERVRRVVQAQAPNAQIPGARDRGGEDRGGDYRTKPAIVERQRGTANGTINAETKPAIVTREGRPGVNDHNAPGQSEVAQGPAQGQPQNNDGASSKRDRGGWSKFGPPAGGRTTPDLEDKGGRADQQPSGSSRGNTPASRDRYNPSSAGGQGSAPANEDRGGFRKFPSASHPEPNAQQPSASPSSSGGGGGWQRFPSGSAGRQNDNPSAGGRDRSTDRKPPLELNKPIVTPRSTPSPSRMPERSEPRMSPPSAPSSRNPEMRSEPHGGGYDRGAGHSSGGGNYDRGAGRSGGGGGGNSGGNRGNSGGGGGDKGGSKSSGPKSR